MTLPVVAKLRKNLSGLRFGRLLVLAFHSKVGNRIMYSCMCECGTEALVRGPDLTNGHSQSCGCLTKEKIREALTTHGRTGTAEHLIWKDMRRRCRNPRNKRYERYGGRGITICARWDDFALFLADMGDRPSPSHSMDRIDNDGPYSPENCRWATAEQQANNKSTSRFIEFGGQRMTTEQWNRALGWPAGVIRKRLHNGWSIDRALSTAPAQRKAP